MKVTGDYWKDGHALVEGLLSREVARHFMFLMQDRIAEHASPELTTTHAAVVEDRVVQMHSLRFLPLDALLWGLTPAVSQIIGRNLLPTYSFFRIYRKGQHCLVHSDRYSCEISLSLTLGYSDDKAWPLEVSNVPCTDKMAMLPSWGDEPYSALSMQPGDGVLYQGVTYNHGRLTPNPNEWSAHLFMHWVDRDGPQAYEAFDRRLRPGEVDFSFKQRAPAPGTFFSTKL